MVRGKPLPYVELKNIFRRIALVAYRTQMGQFLTRGFSRARRAPRERNKKKLLKNKFWAAV